MQPSRSPSRLSSGLPGLDLVEEDVRPLRILFLSSELGDDIGTGGIGSYISTVTPALARRGHDVHVLSCRDGLADTDELRDGVHFHRRRSLRKRGSRFAPGPLTADRVQAAMSAYWRARQLDIKPDIIEAPDWMAEGLLFILGRVPVVAHLHTPLWLIAQHNGYERTRDLRWADRLERTAVWGARCTTSPSELLAKDLRDAGWLARRRPTDIVRYPIDLDAWTDLPPPSEALPRVVAVGRIEARKAPELLMDAVSRVARTVEDAEAVFIGRTSGEVAGESYLDHIQQTRPSAPCRFVGEVPRSHLRDWYASARVVAVASHYESFSMAALEGMAAGRPVVVTNGVGAGEILGSGGVIVPPGDPTALAEALHRYLSDPSAAAVAGTAARRQVEIHCSPDAVALGREVVYGRMLKPRRDVRSLASSFRHRLGAANRSPLRRVKKMNTER